MSLRFRGVQRLCAVGWVTLLLSPVPGAVQEMPRLLPDGNALPVSEVVDEPCPVRGDGKGLEATSTKEPPFWSKVPPVRPFPRPGLFVIPPTGSGYYSFRDVLEDNFREGPPKRPLPPYSITFGSFYDADYRYLDDPANTQHDIFDPIKRVHLGDDWLLSFGGEERVRYMNEMDKRLNGRDNTYELFRSRAYGDLWYKDLFRVYVEFIDAQSFNEDLPPLPIDVDHSDLLNAFVDVKAGQLQGSPLYVRVGRQEMYYGSYRQIAPADWDNTRRTFEGVKTFWHGKDLDVDLFWVKPVVVSPGHFNAADANRNFAGAWLTYRPRKGQALDLYYLYLDQTTPVVFKPTGGRQGYDVNTVGCRYAGDSNHFLWDFEGTYQFGDRANETISAGAASTGIGYNFARMPMNPTFWVYNDYYSGDPNGGAGNGHGDFNQLFGFGHYYFGYLDVVGRENIDDVNVQLTMNPTKWILAGVQGHFFYLDESKDALYNKMSQAVRRDPTGQAGHHVGNELDLYSNIHLSQHQDILLGYSHLFAGEFLKRTGDGGSPELFYIQYSFKW